MVVSPPVIDVLSDLGIGAAPAAKETAASIRPHRTRHECIAEAAYLRAEHRGFELGHELEDWLAAEKDMDAMLAAE
jgi:hypothetical protein